MNSSGCCASIPKRARISAGKSRRFEVTITSARPRMAAASTCRPSGSGSCNDICGQQVLNACHRDGILVPDELAVIGVDNDLILCELSNPPLTSVVLDTYRIGFEAAAVLDRMIQGERQESSSIRIEPRGVEVRQSTDVVCVEEDSRVAAALRFIRLKACSGICVNDVACGVATSRRTLERRFAKLTGKSIQDEITRVRLSRIKQLLQRPATRYRILQH